MSDPTYITSAIPASEADQHAERMQSIGARLVSREMAGGVVNVTYAIPPALSLHRPAQK